MKCEAFRLDHLRKLGELQYRLIEQYFSDNDLDIAGIKNCVSSVGIDFNAGGRQVFVH